MCFPCFLFSKLNIFTLFSSLVEYLDVFLVIMFVTYLMINNIFSSIQTRDIQILMYNVLILYFYIRTLMSIRSNSIITNNVNNETEKRQQTQDLKMQNLKMCTRLPRYFIVIKVIV